VCDLLRRKCLVAIGLALTAQGAGAAELHFQNTCSDAVQDKFQQAVTLLHSFEYPETTRLFREITSEDPDCAMARWGSAMSIWHPLWAPPGTADLEAGMATLAATRTLDKSPREAAYIDALMAFFSSTDTGTHRQRALAFEAEMEVVYATHLDDPEAAVFYSLALLAAADPRDKSYARQYKSAGLLNWVHASQPEHPGVLHYLIHSYDFPGLAHLALDAAMIYADAAPDSAHAQHMPSHIFTRLGLWERSLASNHDSTRSAAAFTERANLPGHYDEGLHSMDYLMYAMMQTARDDEALDLLARLAGITRTDTENFKVAYTYAAAPARYALERRQWAEAADLAFIREDFAWDEFGWAQSIHYFARGIGAARMGDIEGARQALVDIRSLSASLPETTLPYWREEVQVHIDAVSSWIAFAEGDMTRAIALARAAADREDAVDKHPVTPGEVLPARELLADMLAEAGRFDAALVEYLAVLKGSPNRLNTMIGAALAAEQVGDADLAAMLRGTVDAQTAAGNGTRANLSALLSD
jgi:tetratricopeptide (TPR) repeat protein